MKIYRYANKYNISSLPFRWWTWFWDLSEIERYNNNDQNINLWWTILVEKEINNSKSYIIEAYSRHYDLFKDYESIQNLLWEDYDMFCEVNNCKDDDELLKLIKYNLSEDTYNLIKTQPFYNQKTMWLDNLLVKRLKLNGYDSLIRKIDNNIFEVFIINI